MAANIGDLILGLFVDDSNLVRDVQTSAQKAGDAGGKTLGQRMSKALGTAVRTGAGTALGGAVGAFAGSTAQAGDAVALLGARTGKTREELAGYEDRLRSIHSQNFGADFNDIADVLSQVETGLGLAGDEADDFTKKALGVRDTFNLGINEQLRAARPLIENFGVTGKQAMDLIVSGLQSGGDNAEDLLDTFQEYSVNFRDMGFDAKRFLGILLAGLKNGARNTDQIADAVKEFDIRIRDGSATSQKALEALGIDAADFTAKLGSGALSGADALALINTKLRAVGDTSKQEQIGVGLYGTKWEDVGAKAILALDTTGDEITSLTAKVDGAGDRLTESLGTGPTAAFHAFLRSVFGGFNELLAKIPGLEQALTPLAVIFGPRLAATIGAGLGGIAGFLSGKLPDLLRRGLGRAAASAAVEAGAEEVAELTSKQIAQRLAGKTASNAIGGGLAQCIESAVQSSRVGTAVDRVGDFLGTKLGKALSIAFAAVAVVELAQTFSQVTEGIRKQGEDLVTQTSDFIKVASTQALQDSRRAFEEELAREGADPIGDFLGLSARPALRKSLDEINSELARRAGEIPQSVATSIDHGTSEVTESAQDMVSGVPAAVAGALPEVKSSAKQISAEIAAGIREGRQKPLDAFQQLQEDLKHQMTPTAEAARLAGQLTSEALYDGLHSKDPLVKAEAADVKDAIFARLEELKKAGPLGQKAMDLLKEGMRSKSLLIRQASRDIATTIETNIKPNTKPKGEQGGKDVAAGLNDPAARTAVVNAVRGLVRFIQSLLTINAHVTVNARVGQTQSSSAGPGKQHGGDVEAYRPYIVGETRPELFVPRVPGYIYPNVQRGLAALGGTGDFHLHMPVSGVPLLKDGPRDLSRIAQQLSDTGLLAVRRRLRFSPT